MDKPSHAQPSDQPAPPAPTHTPGGHGEPLFRCVVPPFRLGELLMRIGERRLTGRLSLSSSTAERTLYFFSGYPVFAQSSLFSERIGAIGVRHGLFGRDDVKRALELARQHGRELGRALLELEVVDGQSLFQLLSLQLLDQLSSACGNAEARALFIPDAHAVDHVAILRVHPLSATLASVRGLAEDERDRTLNALAARAIETDTLPDMAGEWLVQLGYMGDPRGLLQGQVTVGAIRSRLVARMRPYTREAFDGAAAPRATGTTGAPQEPGARVSAHQVAELLTLTLLVAGCLELKPSDEPVGDEELPQLEQTLRRALEPGALRLPLEVPEGPPMRRSSLGDALNAYLLEPRPEALSARLNVWGPAAEIEADDPVLNPLLTLYLTIKPEARPEAILGVDDQPGPDAVAESYAHYHEFLSSLSQGDCSLLTVSKVAELHHCIDWAFSAMLPGSEMPHGDDASHSPGTETGQGPDAPQNGTNEAGFADEGTPTEFFESVQAFEAAHASDAPGPVAPKAASDPSQPPAPGDSWRAPHESLDALASRVEAQLINGDWTAAREALEERKAQDRLPPTMRLSLAIAQREEARAQMRPAGGGVLRALLWLAIGFAAGWLLRTPGLFF